jgi:hypothetical protein
MPIHEKSLIRPENLVTHEHLEIEGVDVSGHWSTFINSRAGPICRTRPWRMTFPLEPRALPSWP